MDLPAVRCPLGPGPRGASEVSSAASVLVGCGRGGRWPHSIVAIPCLASSFWRLAHNLHTHFYWANTFLFISPKCTWISKYSPQENRDAFSWSYFPAKKARNSLCPGDKSRATSQLILGLAWDKLAAVAGGRYCFRHFQNGGNGTQRK